MRLAAHAVNCAAVVFSLMIAGSAQVLAVSAWDEIRASVFSDRKIEDGRGLVALSAPSRPDDMRVVPIGVEAAFKDGRSVKSVTVMIDENPTPVVAVFEIAGNRESVALKSNFRVDRQSEVRAVVEASDGKLYMVSQLVKFAGGQASCSAPPQGDPAEIAANMGKMQLAELPSAGLVSTTVARAKLDMSHPNHTGMVMDQQTLLYTPMKMVSEIEVRQGKDKVMHILGSIALSQNPSIEFDFQRNGADALDVTLKDTDGGQWSKSFPIGPKS